MPAFPETGITKRATYDLLKDLEGSGMIKAERPSPLNPHNTKPISYAISDIGIVFQHVFKSRFNNDRDMAKELMLSNTYRSLVTNLVTNLIRDNIVHLGESDELRAPWRPDPELANRLREAYQDAVATGREFYGKSELEFAASEDDFDVMLRLKSLSKSEAYPDWITAAAIYESGKFVDALTKLILGFPASANLFFSQIYGWQKILIESLNTQISLDHVFYGDSPIDILYNVIRTMDPGDAIVPKEYLLAYLLS